MAIIKSGASTDVMTVDAVSKAARVTLYDSLGVPIGFRKTTYRAAISALLAGASTSPFLTIEGSATKTVILQRVVLSGAALTAVQYLNYEAKKYSTAASGGTSTTLTNVSNDSTALASSILIKAYTASPTAGTLVGLIASKRTLAQASLATAAGLLDSVEFDFRSNGSENTGIYLRGIAQGVSIGFQAAPASGVTLSGFIEWTEE